MTIAKFPYAVLGGCEAAVSGGMVYAVANAALDLNAVRAGPTRGKQRISRHVTGMCAALIATTTAVAITVVGRYDIVPELVLWLGPTVALTPVIVIWTRRIEAGTFRY
ncbi:MAG: hypothetical protein AAGJ70_04425 [Pseudomonadota bacterium]